MSELSEQLSDLFTISPLLQESQGRQEITQEKAKIAKNDVTSLSQLEDGLKKSLVQHFKSIYLPQGDNPPIAIQTLMTYNDAKEQKAQLVQNKQNYSQKVFSLLYSRLRNTVSKSKAQFEEYMAFLKTYVEKVALPNLVTNYEKAKRAPAEIKQEIGGIKELLRTYMKAARSMQVPAMYATK